MEPAPLSVAPRHDDPATVSEPAGRVGAIGVDVPTSLQVTPAVFTVMPGGRSATFTLPVNDGEPP